MAWQGAAVTILRTLINDVDPDDYTYTDDRLITTFLVAGQLNAINVDFLTGYTIDVTTSTITPDPTAQATKDDPFVVLTCLRAACIIIGSEIKSQSGNSISIKDGPSAIDLRGVTGTLNILYKDLMGQFDQLLLEYRAGNSVAGQAILGPYSPGGWMLNHNYIDPRSGGGYLNDGY